MKLALILLVTFFGAVSASLILSPNEISRRGNHGTPPGSDELKKRYFDVAADATTCGAAPMFANTKSKDDLYGSPYIDVIEILCNTRGLV